MSKTSHMRKGEESFSPKGLRREQDANDALPCDSVLASLSSLGATEHDRRTFLKMAGVPCLTACVSSCVAGWPSLALGAGSAPAEDSRFYRRGPVLRKAALQENALQAVSPRVRDRRSGAGLLRSPRESRRQLLHAGAFARVRRAHRSIEKKPLFHFCPGLWRFQ